MSILPAGIYTPHAGSVKTYVLADTGAQYGQDTEVITTRGVLRVFAPIGLTLNSNLIFSGTYTEVAATSGKRFVLMGGFGALSKLYIVLADFKLGTWVITGKTNVIFTGRSQVVTGSLIFSGKSDVSYRISPIVTGSFTIQGNTSALYDWRYFKARGKTSVSFDASGRQNSPFAVFGKTNVQFKIPTPIGFAISGHTSVEFFTSAGQSEDCISGSGEPGPPCTGSGGEENYVY